MKKTLLALTTVIALTACSNDKEASQPQEKATSSNVEETNSVPQDFYKESSKEKIQHIHGIGYVGNLEGVSVATHHGLKIYQNGNWLASDKEQHDYMGFQATKNGFFASGHPETGSSLKNPLGLVKSTNGGASFEKLAFYGESDFHNMAAGYNSEAVYVYNERPNSKLQQGFYVSTDSGQTWKQSNLSGISGEIRSFAIHPDKSSVVAMSTKKGVFFSTDSGNTFELFSKPKETIAITVGKEDIFYSYITENKQQALARLSISTNEEVNIPTPSVDSNDPIMYIAQHPQNPTEMTFATAKANVYFTTNGGEKWEQIVKDGNIQ
ncbi:F510_1955 family glycosylhydrolase [Priestia taiwanensis]|uniref:Sortilin N-terminal domain-containing protein n=1 Tax=Priestia taiwanensis TaxID=1347902 RepID=A0A917EL01_9BACI|nr:VPS10, VPS10 domain protein [Priestia taiwanensis]MBM7361802.1 hypothetical protein [Priestia taiwanensis]GGE57098.1 hypothetical protein GCM10007140_04290 [Priestia taiwanensis]